MPAPELKTLQVHVVHYTPFSERRRHLEHELEQHGLQQLGVHWILSHDREAIDAEAAKQLVGTSESYGLAMVSVILKHLEAFRAAAESPHAHHLILEDDVVLVDGFLDKLAGCIAELPRGWDMLFIGSGNGMHIPWWRRRAGETVYYRGCEPCWWGGGGTSRCSEAYLVAPAFARRFLASPAAAPPYRHAIDWLMAESGSALRTNSWWCEPALAHQGMFDSWTKNSRMNQTRLGYGTWSARLRQIAKKLLINGRFGAS